MTDHWADRLSEYVDGELQLQDAQALEAHLASCATCKAVLVDLRRVSARARALDDTPPVADLWPGIARAIGVVAAAPARTGRRLAFSVPQLLAASIALIAVSGGAVWFATHRGVPPAVVEHVPTAAIIGATASWTGAAPYAAAIAELDSALQEGRKAGRLDTATIGVLERNLTIIDSAIAQAQRAVLADPGSAYLNQHLAETMQRKLELLRGATSLAASRT
jgi:anti-sigma factor RsiW